MSCALARRAEHHGRRQLHQFASTNQSHPLPARKQGDQTVLGSSHSDQMRKAHTGVGSSGRQADPGHALATGVMRSGVCVPPHCKCGK